MENIILTQDELREIQLGVRVAILEDKKKETPFACAIDEDLYFKYIAKIKEKVMSFLPFSYLGFRHTHKDTYVHFASKERLELIMSLGYLTNEYSDENCTLGKAIYTYPLHSGMFFYNKNVKDGMFMIFDAEAEHVHITQTDDTPYAIGEADFFQDKLYIENPRLITYEEMKKLSEDSFDWEYSTKHYFGLLTDEKSTYQNLYKTLEKYN